MSCDEFIGYVVKKEGIKWEYFIYFLGELNEILLNRHPNINLVYVFDNVSIHHTSSCENY
jgi:hypothetical protein